MKKILTGAFALNLGAIVALWWVGSSSTLFAPEAGSTIVALGRLAGLLLEFTLLIQLLLISRTPFIEKAFGFDNLNKLHRWIGYSISATFFIHPLFLTWGYSTLGGLTLKHQFLAFIGASEEIRDAVLGIFILFGAIILSLPFIRKYLKYGPWHVSHLFMYLAIFLFFGHQKFGTDISAGVGLYYWLTLNYAVFAMVLAFRFLQPFYLYHKYRFTVSKVVRESPSTHSIYISGRRMNEFKFESGQYIHVSFMKKGLWEPHPFSFSSPFNGQYARISLKNLGDFTSRIATITPDTKVLIEGPFGRFTESVAKGEKFLLIAGGIGITPIRALVETLTHKSKDVALVYGNKTEEDVVFKDELNQLGVKRSHFVTGHITTERIAEFAPDYKDREIYICGPIPMMDSLSRALKLLGVPREQIHFEKFSY